MKKQNTLLIITILVVSVFSMNGLTLAQASSDPELQVSWQVVDEFNEHERHDQNSQWIFGPQPTVWVGYAENMTSIEENGFRVEVNTSLFVNITVPKAFMGVGNNMSSVGFWGYMQGVDAVSAFGLGYNVTGDEWEAISVRYEPGSQQPSTGEFLSHNEANSVFTETEDEYFVSFNIVFIADIGTGIFWTGMKAIDQEGRPVTPSWLARLQSGTFETPPIGLGKEVNVGHFALPERYYAEVIDNDGNILHYVDAYDNFTFQISANVEFGEVKVPFSYITFDPKYKQSVSYAMPNDYRRFLTGWTPVTEAWPLLTFVYNGTNAYATVSYMQDVSWSWNTQIMQWVPTIDFQVNETVDLTKFYISTDVNVKHSGALISWTGQYTNFTDMNPDQMKSGGTIKGEPWLWAVNDTNSEPLYARPEIDLHHTVRLGFKDAFMEGFVRMNGEVVRRADPGDILNMSLIVHAPTEEINGTVYIPLNWTNVDVDGTLYDIAGVNVTTIRDNITLSFSSEGIMNNETHRWRVRAEQNITLDMKNDLSYVNSSVEEWMYWFNGTFISYTLNEIDDFIIILNHNFSIGNNELALNFDIKFANDTPAMKIDEVRMVSGVRQAWQLNISQAGLNNFVMYPNTMNFTNPDVSGSTFQEFDSNQMIWSPAHLIIGNLSMWDPQKWTVTEDGAIDLDGNVFTTEDQYFVKRTGYFDSWGNTTVEGMWVGVLFDPSPGEDGDEFHSNSWMGVATLEVEFKANETFYWYHASDFSKLNSSEMANVQETMWADYDNEIAAPGYLWVAWLSKNRTIDLSAITGLDSNYWKTSWFAWGTNQWFNVATSATSATYAGFQAEYAGMLIFNDLDPDGNGPLQPNQAPDFEIEEGEIQTDEVTHVVLIDDIESLELRRPFGATNDTGNVTVDANTTVTFGISIYNVSVTLYPLQVENSDGLRGPWAFRESYEGALGLNRTNFDYWITHANITEMAFDITFSVDMVQYDPEDEQTWNHAVAFKVDQKIGDWDLEEFDDSVLDDRGLAVNFFGILGTATRTEYTAGEQPVTDTNGESLTADYYEFGAEDSPFANVSMGGMPYTWAGDGYSTNYTSGSSTVPIGAFSVMYESESGESVTQWNVDASMLFMTAGYTHWGGQEVRVDPVFVSYTSAQQTPLGTTDTTTTGTITGTDTGTGSIPTGGGGNAGLMVMVAGVLVVVVIACVLIRRRR